MILVTMPWCTPCNELKEWMHLTGNDEGVEVVDAGELDTASLGISTVPCLVVDNAHFVGNEEIRPFLSSLNVEEL
jgi:glutaredoxin